MNCKKYWKNYSVFGDLAGKSSMPRPLQNSTILIWCQVVSYWTSDQTFHHIQSIFGRKLQHENTLVHKLCLTIQSTPFNFVKEMYIAFFKLQLAFPKSKKVADFWLYFVLLGVLERGNIITSHYSLVPVDRHPLGMAHGGAIKRHNYNGLCN